jgi:hypothetical protein
MKECKNNWQPIYRMKPYRITSGHCNKDKSITRKETSETHVLWAVAGYGTRNHEI